MRTVVLGAGAVGTATAFHLAARHGHEVTVIERQPEAALETSWGNGGVIHASEVEPWSQPGMPRKIIGWLGQENAPLLLRYGAIPHMWRWGLAFARNCTPERFRRNAEANLRLALLSLATLQELRAETGIAYDLGTRGVLKIYRSRPSLDAAAASCRHLERHGLQFEVVDPARCVAIDPALASTEKTLAGALYFARDEVGDCNKFTQGLAAWSAARHGVAFRYGTTVRGLEMVDGRVGAVITDAGRVPADNVVAAMGSFTPLLLRQVGLRPAIYPVKGVSITVKSAGWPGALRTPVIDDSGLYGLVPIGDRLRVSGSAEITGYDTTPSRVRCQAIIDKVVAAFPDFRRCFDPRTARFWAGLRPVTPSGTPCLGRTPISNLFINAGHGHLGWTLACGSGRVVAAIVAGADPGLDLTGFRGA
ncbi:MAG: D-amino acid dehydrogenase [Dongiaceae bacterium]